MDKPGIRTTEAWGSFLTTFLLLLVGYGIFTQEQADTLLALILPAIPLALSVVPMVTYTAVCVNNFETTWLRKLGSTHNVDGEPALQSESSPWTTHEFIAFWNSVAGMVRVRAG